MSSVPSERTTLLSTSKHNINQISEDEDTSSVYMGDVDAVEREIGFDLATPVPVRKAKKSKSKFTESMDNVSPIIELKDDLLTNFQNRALTDSTGSLYEDLINRPTIHEYEETIRNVYGISDEDDPSERGRTFMADLKSKRQGIISFEQIITFGKKVRHKMVRHIHKLQLRSKAGSYGANVDSIFHKGNSPPRSETDDESHHEFGQHYPRRGPEDELPFRYWVDILNPTNSQVEDLQQAYGIHPLTSEDILIRGTREKLEEYASYMYFVFNERQRVPNSNRYRDVNLNLLLFPGIVISIHMLPVKSLTQVMYHVQHSVLPDNVPVDWVAYKFLDMITDEFVLTVDAIYREVDYLDTMVNDMGDENKEEILRRIGVARQRLTQLRGSLLSKREILATLSSSVRTSLFVENTTKIYFRDVMDHVVLMIQRLDMANEMLNNTSSLYLAMISIEIAATDQKMNEAMKCFGAVATIMLPLSVMTGLWGMNVTVPGQTGIAPDGILWFGLIILSFVIWIVVAGIIFRYKRWL